MFRSCLFTFAIALFSGCGKTFLALRLIFDVLIFEAGGSAAFATRNLALCLHVAKWLFMRLAQRFDAKKAASLIESRFFMLFSPFNDGLRRVTVDEEHGYIAVGKALGWDARAFGEEGARDDPGDSPGTIVELDEECAAGRTWLVDYEDGPTSTDEAFFAAAPAPTDEDEASEAPAAPLDPAYQDLPLCRDEGEALLRGALEDLMEF